MEMTKKEYIGRLKKELDTIEQRYQALLNENCMIGEDFRSQALMNKLYSQELEQQIADLKEKMKQIENKMDDKDLEMTIKGRESESF